MWPRLPETDGLHLRIETFRRYSARIVGTALAGRIGRVMRTLILPGEVGHRDGLIELEFETRFRGNLDLLSLCGGLNAGAARSTDGGADCRALAAASDGADDGSEGSSSADGFRGAFATGGAGLAILTADQGVGLSLEHHADNVELQFAAARDMAGRTGLAALDVHTGARRAHNA